MDSLATTVIAAREDPQARKLLADLLEVRRYLYAELLSRACERGQSLESLSNACVTVACHARWEKDVRSTMDLELEMLAVAARAANNAAFLHLLGSLHRLFEQLPAAWLNGRPLEAIERRMLRTDDLLQAHECQSLRSFLLEALEVEDQASIATLCGL